MMPVSQVGVLSSHVHSIVMSSNGMEGRIPTSISQLTYLRMIELATMPGKACHCTTVDCARSNSGILLQA